MEVIIFFEHKVRELPALRRLRDELVSRGHNVSIYSIAFEWFDAYRHAKKTGIDTLLVPWCYRAEQFWRFSPFYEINPHLKMINLHHEQITAKITERVLMPRDRAACDYPYHFCWTAYFEDGLLKAGVPDDRVFVTGNLRLEPPSGRGGIRRDLAERFSLDPSKQWILYAESRRIDEISLSKIRYDFQEMSSLADEECDRYFGRWKASLDKTIAQIRALPEEFFRQYELIYRPHPGSTVDFDLGDCPKIISERPVSDWLGAVDAFCTWQSTSAFEAEMSGLPVFFHETVPIPEEERMPGVCDYVSIRDIREICGELLEKCLDVQRAAPIYERYVGRYSPDTASRYSDAIEAIVYGSEEDLPLISYSRWWIQKMFWSELIIRAMFPTGLIRLLHWPHTASMMYEDIPFKDADCADLHGRHASREGD